MGTCTNAGALSTDATGMDRPRRPPVRTFHAGCLTIFQGRGITTHPHWQTLHRIMVIPPKEVLVVSGYGYGGYGIGLRRLLIFLLVIATIFVFAGVGF